MGASAAVVLTRLSANATGQEIADAFNSVVLDIELSHETSNDSWLLSSAFLIFTMQAGFAMLESGMIPVRFSVNVMMKITANVAATSVAFFAVGWAFAFGKSSGGFIGHTQFFLTGLNADNYALWVYHLSVAVTATTVVSGAVAGRMRFAFYTVFCIYVAAFVFPLASHWHWHEDGWLHHLHYQDFAGAGPIHILGTVIGLLCSFILGPREGVFTQSGAYIPIRSSPFNTVFGSLLLLIGWFSLNTSSGHSIQNGLHELAALSAVNSAVASGAGVLAAIFFLYSRTDNGHVDVFETIKATQAALVSICAACDVVYPFEAAIIGAVGALLCLLANPLLLRWRVDDPVGVFGSHGVAGLWALISTGLFSHHDDLIAISEDGLFRSGSFKLLGTQLAGALAFICWGLVCGGLFVWLVAMYIMPIRIPKTMEKIGSDTIEHNLLTLVRNNRIPVHMISSRGGDVTMFSSKTADITSHRDSRPELMLAGTAHQMPAGQDLHSPLVSARPSIQIDGPTNTPEAVHLNMTEDVPNDDDHRQLQPEPASDAKTPAPHRHSLPDTEMQEDRPKMASHVTFGLEEEPSAPELIPAGSPGKLKGPAAASKAFAEPPDTVHAYADSLVDSGASPQFGSGHQAPHQAAPPPDAVGTTAHNSARPTRPHATPRSSWASSMCAGPDPAEADILLAAEEMSISIDMLDVLSDEGSVGLSDEERKSRRPSVLASRVMEVSAFFTDQMTGGSSKKPKKNKKTRGKLRLHRKGQYRQRMQERLRAGDVGSPSTASSHLRPPTVGHGPTSTATNSGTSAERRRMPSIDEGLRE